MSTPSFDLSKPVAIGSDHAGFAYKVGIVQWLNNKGLRVADMGVYEDKSVDYPDYAHPVAKSVAQGEAAFGILLCGTGNGVCMTANKHQSIRAAMCWDSAVANLVRLHNNANIICLPARFIALSLAESLIEIFMETAFEGGRHARRVEKIGLKLIS
jgi:ribose 5-phosphate isomerase B